MTQQDARSFRSAIARCLGLAFDDSKLGFLGEVLERRLAATGGGAKPYLARLDSKPSRDEIGALAFELTVPETYFFRHFDQFRAFAEVALPDRLARRTPGEQLAILSAGCASGEEAYSLAMLLHERFPDQQRRIAIRAFDVSPKAIERATRARYGSWAMREMPEDSRERWFEKHGRDFVVAENVRSAVRFDRLNLANAPPGALAEGAYDVVFFRNVLMYFTPEVAKAVIERLTRCLVRGGYLFLGHAETLTGLSLDFHLCHTHETFYYQRKDAARAESDGEQNRWSPPPDVARPFVDDSTSWIETIQSSSQRIAWLSRQIQPVAFVKRPDRASEIEAVVELLKSERFEDALSRLDALPATLALDPDVLMLRASLLAHRGELLLAEAVCAELLAVSELSAGAHYLLALCREGRGDLAGAIDHDETAAYLDDGFAMPRLHRGLMARRAGDRTTARRELERAIPLLEREQPSRLVLFGGGFGRDALIRLCRAELARLGGAG